MLPLQPIISPSIPFEDTFIDRLKPGCTISIHGTVPHNASEFSINFICALNDGKDLQMIIAFHFRPLFCLNYVVRNTLINYQWGSEEGCQSERKFPFLRGSNFEMEILVNEHEYRVTVNGDHFTNYSHRVPYQNVKYMQILRDVVIHRIQLQSQSSSKLPTFVGSVYKNMNTPIDRIIPSGMHVGKKILFSGFPTSKGLSFIIDLFYDDVIAFRFRVRFDERSVVRNSKVNGVWQTEEYAAKLFPFSPSNGFDMKIECEHYQYIVFINDAYFCSFAHRLPYIKVDSIRIAGDVFIKSLSI